MNVCAEEVSQFGFVNFEIASDKNDYIAVVIVFLINDSFAELFRLDFEIIAEILDRLDVGSRYFFKRKRLFVVSVVNDSLCRLNVGLVIAFLTDGKSILSDIGKEHKFVRNGSAHHSAVGFYGNDVFRAGALENANVRIIASLIILFQIFHRGMEGIRVLHSKFADADKSSSASGLVSELCLYLIDHKRKIVI